MAIHRESARRRTAGGQAKDVHLGPGDRTKEPVMTRVPSVAAAHSPASVAGCGRGTAGQKPWRSLDWLVLHSRAGALPTRRGGLHCHHDPGHHAPGLASAHHMVGSNTLMSDKRIAASRDRLRQAIRWPLRRTPPVLPARSRGVWSRPEMQAKLTTGCVQLLSTERGRRAYPDPGRAGSTPGPLRSLPSP